MTTRAIDIARRAIDRQARIDESRRCLQMLHEPGDVYEVRALDVPMGRSYRGTVSGYYDDPGRAAADVQALDERGAPGVYVTINPCLPALLARSANRLTERAKHTTADGEIVRRRWLPIDIDPHRPSGIAADEPERQTALELAAQIEELLRGRGWPYPLLADSGNGRYQLYRIDLPNDPDTASLVKAFYAGLNAMLGTYDPTRPHSTIDTTVYNAARILRIGGTTNRKGDPTADRPHRPVAYSEPTPGCPVDVVPVELIHEVAALGAPPKSIQPPAAGQRAPSGNGHASRLDVAQWLTDRGVKHTTKAVDRGMAYIVPCPFDAAHGANGESAVVQRDDGLLTFECKHNSCQGRRWADYRDAIGRPNPQHYGRLATNHREQTIEQASQADEPPEPPAFTRLIDCRELLALDLRPRFLVRGVLVAGQPCVIGGRSKTLKTSVATDLVVSLGSGSKFLGEFDTERVNVAFWSGESGAATIRETARRVADAKGVDLQACSILWSFDLPKLTRDDHLQALAETIKERSISVAVLDPLYLSLLTLETAGQAGNLYAMGTALQPLGEIGQQTRCTMIVLHHFRKSGQPDPDEPAALEELAQSGVAEWCRQWLLLARRTPYQADGHHELWFRAGGSFGHAGLWAIDIDEGQLDPDTLDGRRWDVGVKQAGDVRNEVRRERENRKAEQAGEREADHRRRVLVAIGDYPDGATKRDIKEDSRLNSENFARAVRQLVKECRIQKITVEKNGRKYDGLRLVQRSNGTSGTGGTA